MTASSGPQRDATRRRRFLAAAGTAAAVPAAAALIGSGPLAGTARAAAPGGLADYAPIPPGALGPAPNADGYFAGKPGPDERTRLSDTIPTAWTVVTRDLAADRLGGYANPSVVTLTIDGLRIETDGELLLDAVWLGRSLKDLERLQPRPLE